MEVTVNIRQSVYQLINKTITLQDRSALMFDSGVTNPAPHVLVCCSKLSSQWTPPNDPNEPYTGYEGLGSVGRARLEFHAEAQHNLVAGLYDLTSKLLSLPF
jgi:hypothetical protein